MLKRLVTITSLFLASFNVFSQPLPEAYYYLTAALEQNDKAQSLFWADSCLKIKKQRIQYQIGKGRSCFINGQYSTAISYFEIAEKSRKGIASIWLAKCYCMLWDTSKCFAHLKAHLESSFREKESEILLDATFDRLHSSPEWKKLWDQNWYNITERTIAEAEYLNQIGSYDETIELLETRIKGNKSRYVLYGLRGDAYFATGRLKAALNDYKIALKKSKKNPQYLAKIAKTLAEQNQIQPALKKIDLAVEQSGGDPKIRIERAKILFKSNLLKMAYPDFKYYLNFYPNSSEINALYAQCAIETGHYVEALLSLAKLVKLNPGNPQFRYLRGVVLNKTEQPRIAIPEFDFSIQNDYRVAESYLQKGLAYIMIGEKDEACKCFSTAIQLGNFKAQELQYKYCK